jgi:hypothetical protein
MTVRDVLLPLFVEVILTFVLLFWMAYLRTSATSSGAVATRDIALREPNWPPQATQVANAFHNQLELPMLFYVLTILAGTRTMRARFSWRWRDCWWSCG